MKSRFTAPFLFLFLCFFMGNRSYAQWISLPDAEFESWLELHHPNLISNNQLNTDSAATLTDLTIGASNIEDFTGLEYFTGLIHLSVTDNPIVTFPDLTNTNNLKSLNLSYDQLTIPPNISFYPELRELNLAKNELETLPSFTSTTELVKINCSGNSLSTLPDVSDLSELELLNASSNQLTSLPDFNENYKLKYLYLTDNQLFNIPDLSTNVNLIEFSCAKNLISSTAGLEFLIAATFIDISFNQLSTLPNLSMNTLVEEFNCAHNQIDELPALFFNPNIKILNCSYNLLTELPVLHPLDSLQELICGYNMIEELPDLSENVFLHTLDASGNLLDTLPDFSMNSMIKYLHLGDNRLKSITYPPAYATLTNLVIAGNYLTEMDDLTGYLNLKFINANDNLIENLPDFSSFGELTSFYIQRNKLDFSDARTLRILDEKTTIPGVGFYYSPQKRFGKREYFMPQNGQAVVLRISPQDSAEAYQWFYRLDSNAAPVAISGATDTVLVIPNVNSSDYGYYSCTSYGSALQLFPMWNPPGISEFESEFKIITDSLFQTSVQEATEPTEPSVYPSPADDRIFVSLAPQKGAITTVQMFNLNGKKVLQRSVSEHSSDSNLEIEVKNEVNGVYLLVIKTAKENIFTKKILIFR